MAHLIANGHTPEAAIIHSRIGAFFAMSPEVERDLARFKAAFGAAIEMEKGKLPLNPDELTRAVNAA